MIQRNRKKTANLGSLITALYDEAARVTSSRKLQTFFVCLALIDMQIA